MTVRAEWSGYGWAFILASIPFALASGRLIQDSLSDVPEAYLVFIPLVAYFWIALSLHRMEAGRSADKLRALVVWLLIGTTGLILEWALGAQYSSRFDTSAFLLWPAWTGLVVWVLYGSGALARVWKPLLYLYLVWPPLYMAIINFFNPHLERASFAILYHLARDLSWLSVIRPGSYAIQYGNHLTAIANVTAACSGSDSILALLVVFPAALLVFESTVTRKLALIGIGCLLAFIANNIRIIVILGAVHAWGPYWGFDVFHPLLGPIMFVALLASLLSYGGLTVPRRAQGNSVSVAARASGQVYWLLGAAVGVAALLFHVANPFLPR